MISSFKKIFKKKTGAWVDTKGWTHEDGKIPHKNTPYLIQVNPQEALKSSLAQMGSGIKLSPHLAEELAWKLKEIEDAENTRIDIL